MYSAVLYKEAFMKLGRELKKTLTSEKGKKKKKGENTDVSGQIDFETALFPTDMSQKTDTSVTCRDGIVRELSRDLADAGADEPPQEADAYAEEEWGLQPSGDTGSSGSAHGSRSVLVRQGYADKLIYHLEKCNRKLLAMKRQCEDCRLVESIEEFAESLMRLRAVLEDYLAEREEDYLAARDMLLDFYFEVSHFFTVYELLDENYVKYTQLCEDGSFFLKLLCVNPGENLKRCMLRGRSAILFSATLLPIQYYKKLLGGEPEDYEVYARSVFHPARRALLVASDVTSKYTRRSEDEYGNIARYIEEIVKNRHGNYMVFCPSYAFLRTIHGRYVDNFGGEGRECILQSESMSEGDREAFLERFRESRERTEQDRVLVGFCVLGGIFSEGIDLKHDSLIGVMIVGTGLPQVSREKEILMNYFDGNGESGFDYAYRYPGMNKVLQAAGRVIRTAQDIGIIALLDERFLQPAYRRLFPREWEQFETVTVNTVAGRVERFWNEWL
ncbi:MAG: ATP-dependent DNA helicase [Lachnospiraceae bacterium]|nr:ATP-dependent DNA helicase [Lachnospiraceae bacterium]